MKISGEDGKKIKPSVDEIIDMMRDKGFDGLQGEPLRVFYSIDRTKRFVLYRCDDGLISYLYEELNILDDEEWDTECNFFDDPDPAYWIEPSGDGYGRVHKFCDIDDALREIFAEPEYKTYFVKGES